MARCGYATGVGFEGIVSSREPMSTSPQPRIRICGEVLSGAELARVAREIEEDAKVIGARLRMSPRVVAEVLTELSMWQVVDAD